MPLGLPGFVRLLGGSPSSAAPGRGDGLLVAPFHAHEAHRATWRPPTGWFRPATSAGGLPARCGGHQPCFLHQHFRKRRKLQLAKSRALFEYTWRFRNESDRPPCDHMPKNNRRAPPRPSSSPRSPTAPDPRRARKPTSGAVVPLNRVRTGGGRGASVPRPPGAGVPGWFGPGRRLGPPVALRHMRGWLVSGRRERGHSLSRRAGRRAGLGSGKGAGHLLLFI